MLVQTFDYNHRHHHFKTSTRQKKLFLHDEANVKLS